MAAFHPSQSFTTNDKVTLKYIDTDPLAFAKPPLILVPPLPPSSFQTNINANTDTQQLHGWTGSSQVWQRNIPGFVAGGYRVIVPDLRGHGESGKPRHGYHVARLVGDVLLIHHPHRFMNDACSRDMLVCLTNCETFKDGFLRVNAPYPLVFWEVF
jgi:hypothetical protein